MSSLPASRRFYPGLAATLETEGLPTVSVQGRASVIDHIQMRDAQLVLFEDCPADPLDVGVIRRIRAEWPVPVIVLAAQDDEDTIVDALDAGADDYLVHRSPSVSSWRESGRSCVGA